MASKEENVRWRKEFWRNSCSGSNSANRLAKIMGRHMQGSSWKTVGICFVLSFSSSVRLPLLILYENIPLKNNGLAFLGLVGEGGLNYQDSNLG